MSVIVRFNGKDLPPEMERLAPGSYVVESLDDVPTLSPDEEAGLRAAMLSLREGQGIVDAEVRRRIAALLP